jgi:hypothetical protein
MWFIFNLQRLAEHLNCSKWRVVELTRPGLHVSEQVVRDVVTDVENVMLKADMDNTIIL